MIVIIFVAFVLVAIVAELGAFLANIVYAVHTFVRVIVIGKLVVEPGVALKIIELVFGGD